MITQSENFVNNIHFELQDFLSNSQGTDDNLPSIWYAMDFEDVDNTLEAISEGNLENRPIIQVIETNLREENQYESSEGIVSRIQANLTFYIVINENYKENYKRKQVLNELANQLKYKFDNYKDSLPHFRRIKTGLPDGILSRDSDNVYSSRQTFYCELIKKVR